MKFFQEILDKLPNIHISSIVADNGSQFQEPFKSWCEEQGYTLNYTRAHSLWMNAIIERAGGTRKRLLYQSIKVENMSNWTDLLLTVANNINTRTSFVTKETPLDLDTSTNPKVHRKVNTILQNRANKKYNVKAQNGADIRPGDWVKRIYDYDSSKIQKASKRGYFPPKVFELLSVTPSKYPNALPSYKLVEKDTGKIVPGSWARWQLLPIPKDTNFATVRGQLRRPAPEVNEEGVERHGVESILRKRVKRNGDVEYYDKWRGYNKILDNTWKSQEILEEDAPGMLERFNATYE